MNRKAMWILGAAAALIAGLVAVPARADWLVTKEGGRFEIKGPYKTKGKLLVFTLPNGNLSSIRLDEVDLEASRIATEEAVAAAEREAAATVAEAQEKQRKKSIISLTDKDFRRVSPPAAEGEEEGEGENENATPGPTSSNSPVQVVNWERVSQDKVQTDGLEVAGTVRNTSNERVSDVQVMANLYDEVGTLVGKVSAQVADPILDPGESSAFTVAAPGLYSFSAVRFDVQSRGFKAKPATPAGATSATTTTS